MNLRPAAEIRESGGGVSCLHPPSHVANLQHHIFNAHFVPNCFASLCFVWVSVPCGEIKNARLSQQKGVGNYNSSSLPLPPEMCLLRFGSFRFVSAWASISFLPAQLGFLFVNKLF